MIDQTVLSRTLCRMPPMTLPTEIFVVDGEINVNGKGSAWGVTFTKTNDILVRRDTDANTIIHETLHHNGLASEHIVVPLSNIAEKLIDTHACNGTRYERCRISESETMEFCERNNIANENMEIVKYRRVR